MQHYTVLFEGDVLPGQQLVAVKQNLVQALKVDSVKVDSWIARGGKELKRDISLDQGKKYIRALAKLGALAYLIPAQEKARIEQVQPADNASFTETGSFS